MPKRLRILFRRQPFVIVRRSRISLLLNQVCNAAFWLADWLKTSVTFLSCVAPLTRPKSVAIPREGMNIPPQPHHLALVDGLKNSVLNLTERNYADAHSSAVATAILLKPVTEILPKVLPSRVT